MRILTLLGALLITGCVMVTAPNGTRAIAFGQAEARVCSANDTSAASDASGPHAPSCVTVRGGSLSDGAIEVLKAALSLPGAILRGAGAALP